MGGHDEKLKIFKLLRFENGFENLHQFVKKVPHLVSRILIPKYKSNFVSKKSFTDQLTKYNELTFSTILIRKNEKRKF